MSEDVYELISCNKSKGIYGKFHEKPIKGYLEQFVNNLWRILVIFQWELQELSALDC